MAGDGAVIQPLLTSLALLSVLLILLKFGPEKISAAHTLTVRRFLGSQLHSDIHQRLFLQVYLARCLMHLTNFHHSTLTLLQYNITSGQSGFTYLL